MGTFALAQATYAWGLDDAVEASHTIYSEDTSQEFDVASGNVVRNLRFELACTGASATDGLHLYVSRNSGAYTRVTTSTSYVRCYTTSPWLADDANTSDRLSGEGSTFYAGKVDLGGATSAFSHTKNQHCEVLWCLEFVSADLSDNDTLDFRCYFDDDTELDGYTVTAQSTIAKVTSTTVDCTLGTLTIAGANATVNAQQDVDCTLGTLAIAGSNATVNAQQDVDCTLGTLTIAGANATVNAQQDVDCTLGTLTIAGHNVDIPAGPSVRDDDYVAADSGSCVVPIPSGTQAGDLLILVGRRYAGAPSTPSGWTYLGGGKDGSGWSFIFYKTATGSDTDPDLGSSMTYFHCAIVAVANADTSNAPSYIVEDGYDSSGTTVSSPNNAAYSDQVPVSADDSLVLWCASSNSGAGALGFVTDGSDRGDEVHNVNPASGQALCIFGEEGVSSGWVGPATITKDTTGGNEFGFAVSVAPDGAALDVHAAVGSLEIQGLKAGVKDGTPWVRDIDGVSSQSGSCVVPIPASAQAGDLLILTGRRWANAPSTPSGWTYLAGGIDNTEWSFTFYKTATGSDADPDLGSSMTYFNCVVAAIVDADTSTAPTLVYEDGYDDNDTTVTCPTNSAASNQITAPATDSCILWVASTNNGAAALFTGATTRGEIIYNEDGSGADQPMAVAAETRVASGAVGPAEITSPASDSDAYGWAIAVGPASAGTDIDCTLGTLTVAGANVTVYEDIDVNCSLGTLTIAGANVGVNAQTDVDCTLGTLAIAGANATVYAATAIDCTLGTLTISGHNPDIQLGASINCTLGTIEISGANVGVNAQTDVNCSLGTLTIAGANVTVNAQTTIACTLGTLAISGSNATIQAATTVNCTLGTLEISGSNATVLSTTNIDCTLGTLEIAGANVTVGAPVYVNCTLGTIEIQGYDTTTLHPQTFQYGPSRQQIILLIQRRLWYGWEQGLPDTVIAPPTIPPVRRPSSVDPSAIRRPGGVDKTAVRRNNEGTDSPVRRPSTTTSPVRSPKTIYITPVRRPS